MQHVLQVRMGGRWYFVIGEQPTEDRGRLEAKLARGRLVTASYRIKSFEGGYEALQHATARARAEGRPDP